jgi:hypothetical protein
MMARLRQLDISLQIISALLISMGRQNPVVVQQAQAALELQEHTLSALFQAYCADNKREPGETLAQVILEAVTLLDNLKDMAGDVKPVAFLKLVIADIRDLKAQPLDNKRRCNKDVYCMCWLCDHTRDETLTLAHSCALN